MENNKAFKYNVEAYISTILDNNKDKIGDINDFIIPSKDVIVISNSPEYNLLFICCRKLEKVISSENKLFPIS